ncbi:MAG: Eco57I restriction-modification methylase domain-containing protein [Aminobacterium colombiense]|uniref:Eco57I restriction-modification methylase domain-containing protein n=1 Tax=Aminobacterium colombiense TaxID=81468 RepID=UPI003D95B169
MTLFDGSYDAKLNAWNFKRLLAQKYDVVVTNPPYMGRSGMGYTVRCLPICKLNYPDSTRAITFAAFIEPMRRTAANPRGYQLRMITHLTPGCSCRSYEKLRDNLMHDDTRKHGTTLGARAFEEICV